MAKKKFIIYTCNICKFERCTRSRKHFNNICGDCLRQIKLNNNDGHQHNYVGSKYFSGKLINKWKRSASSRGYIWELEHADLDNKFIEQNKICVYSGLEMGKNYGKGRAASLDRIDPKIGYTKNNFQFVCAAINIMKYKMTEKEFLQWISIIYNNKQGNIS